MSKTAFKQFWIAAKLKDDGSQEVSVGQGDVYEERVLMSYTFASAFKFRYIALATWDGTIYWKTQGKYYLNLILIITIKKGICFHKQTKPIYKF